MIPKHRSSDLENTKHSLKIFLPRYIISKFSDKEKQYAHKLLFLKIVDS